MGPSLFHINLNPSQNFQTMFLLAKLLPMVKISAKFDHIWGVRVQNPPKKSRFMDAESVRKTLKFLT